MKLQLILWISALGFSTLFYQQDLGLNMFLFALIAVVTVCIARREAFARLDMRIATIVYLLTSLFVFTNHSALAIFMSFITYIVFAGTISGAKNAIYIQGMNGLYQSFLGALHYYMSPKKERQIVTPQKKRDYGFILLCVLLVVGLPIIFASLYSHINPIFEKWVSAIDLSFISIPWLLMTLMGYILISNVTAPAALQMLTEADSALRQDMQEISISEAQEPILRKEQLLGSLVIGVLNALIFFFLVVDIWYVTNNPFLHASELSKAVHEGVGALIASIVIAITLIVILFRGSLNFYKNNHRLRLLTYLWIFLNIVLVLVTAFKNYLYITDFGLTYKRIGVIIYLTLCITGLSTTYLKVAYRKNIYYLIRFNARIVFIVIVLMSSFSWNREITRYNLSQVARPDLTYIEFMSGNHMDLLYAFAKAYPEKFTASSLENIERKHTHYVEKLENETWQSTTLQGIKHRTK